MSIKFSGFLGFSALCLVLFSNPDLRSATITVTNSADSGVGTLREALANAADGDSIDVTGLSGAILLTNGELLVTNSVTIVGPGPAVLSVDGNAASRVFHIGSNTVVSISSLSITNGAAQSFPRIGAGIWNDGATLTVSNCALAGNSAHAGGGVCNDGFSGNATATIFNCTFSGNFADDSGGGIYNNAEQSVAALTISNSTVRGNSASDGGGIFNDGDTGSASLLIANSTISGNFAVTNGGGVANVGLEAQFQLLNSTLSGNSATNGGAVYNDDATLDPGNTIFNAGPSGENIFNNSGTVTSHGYNISSDGGGGLLTAIGDQINTDPLLGSLADNGGPTETHALLCGSPAIDTGDPNFAAPPEFDQRGPGFARIVNGRIDIGAFERQAVCISCDLMVTTTNDSGPGSLRQSLACASNGDTIDASGISGVILLSGELIVSNSVTVLGPGPSNLTLDGHASNRVFHILGGVTAEIAGFTLTNAHAPGAFPAGQGGAIYNDHSSLMISNCLLTGNSAFDKGGVIFNDGSSGSATTMVNNCSLSANYAAYGAGIYNYGVGGSAILDLDRTTITGNQVGSPFAGAGIYNDGGSGNAIVTLNRGTLSGNHADFGGCIYNAGAFGSAILIVRNSNLGGSSGIVGGVIYNYGFSGSAIATLNDSVVIGSSASVGAGIYNDGNGGSAMLILSNSVISANSASGSGGGIYNNYGTHAIYDSTIVGNSCGSLGGGVYNSGTLSMNNSTVVGNSSGGAAGGIFNDHSTLTILNSTLNGNSAAAGGAVYNYGCCQAGATLQIISSTIYGNSAVASGGGIYNDGYRGNAMVQIVNSTLSRNSTSGSGGGIYNNGELGTATVEIAESILNAGASGENIFNDSGTVTSHGYNLSSDDGAGFLTTSGDQTNADPLLGPLQDNGGPTKTQALLPASPAIDAGDPNFNPNDFNPAMVFEQRGPSFPRVLANWSGSARIDIGACEAGTNNDSVGDGIPDGWRAHYFGGDGTTTNDQSCALCDASGTGQNNLFKYVAGLDATNSASALVLQIQNVDGQPDQKDLTFQPLAPGRTYDVEFRSDFDTAVYEALSVYSGPTTNGNRIIVTDLNATNAATYYRVRISLP